MSFQWLKQNIFNIFETKIAKNLDLKSRPAHSAAETVRRLKREAKALAKAKDDGGPEFSSIEDFEVRSGAGRSTVAVLKACGAFGDLPDSDQISLF